jgi:hypothetical protein
MKRECLSLLVVLLVANPLSLLSNADGPAGSLPPVDFNRQIRPVLSDKCFSCHGPDTETRQAGLRLDTQDGAFAALESGKHALVAGKPNESEVIVRITTSEEYLKMPPEKTGKPLSADEISLITRWIEQGAEWKTHWSFQPVKRPSVPLTNDLSHLRNPIDLFIQAKLDTKGLKPSREADKTSLIRRLTLDLTGLPPTPAEVDAFLADQSDNAYETLVDRLLSSKRYGEHMARYWLDAARYGDTHGLHLDNERSMWKYREWVIDAFNNNTPFHQFTIEQLAGDLLPTPTQDQLIATGFNRCNVTTSEGGSIDEEVLVRNTVDRVETTATVFLGLTAGCAVCHDHKFDPLSQKEFYKLFAFFHSTADAPLDGNALAPPPILKTPMPEHTSEIETLNKKIADLRTTMNDRLARIEYKEPENVPPPSTEPKEYVWIEDALPSGATDQGGWTFVEAPEPVHSGAKASKRKSTGLSQHFFDNAAQPLRVGQGDKLFTYVYLDPNDPPKEIMLQWNDGTWEHRVYWGENAIPWGGENSPARRAMGELPKAGEWVRLEVDAAHVGLNPGAAIRGWAFTQHDGTCYWDKAGIISSMPQETATFESLAGWEPVGKSDPAVPGDVKGALNVAADQRNDDHRRIIRNYFLERVYPKTRDEFGPMRGEIEAAEKRKTEIDAAIPTTLVMAEMPSRRETFLLVRGQYDKKGDKVEAGTPAALPPMPKDAPASRLGLAQWLTDREHPLTSRVTVNRFWQQFFGTGIVKTAEDFGAQGQWPTHPELLDWLSADFMENGWNVKRLLKQMVMSHTYRQSSQVTPEVLAIDPTNELLARGPRYRLDAEVLRDSALSISGLLVERFGGKSVKPYQPEGVWEAVGFIGSNTRDFKRDDGDALWRRSLYTFWKRTAPPPSMQIIDAPTRETTCVRRPRTNTPLQALVLLNDPQFVEAARKFAERIVAEGGATAESRVDFACKMTLARPPSTEERAALVQLQASRMAKYAANPELATKLLQVGDSPKNDQIPPHELASWTLVANVLMNLDEFICKE